MMLVVECGRRFRTLPPAAIRSGRDLPLPPEIVYSLWVPAPEGYEVLRYIEDEPWLLPALPVRRERRAFCEDLA
jgi:hypothetical protein